MSTDDTSDTIPAPAPAPAPKAKRGFAVMDPARVREIAALGGKTAQATGAGHQFTSEEAQTAGRKGGLAVQAKLRAARQAAGT